MDCCLALFWQIGTLNKEGAYEMNLIDLAVIIAVGFGLIFWAYYNTLL